MTIPKPSFPGKSGGSVAPGLLTQFGGVLVGQALLPVHLPRGVFRQDRQECLS